MIDLYLARKHMAKLGRALIEAYTSRDPEVVDKNLQTAINEQAFIIDILHLDEIQALDITPSKPNSDQKEVKTWDLQES